MDAQAKKTLLRKIPHGLYIIGVAQNGQVNAFTGTWLTQASFEPPLIALGVKKDSGSFTMLKESGVFTVNFLRKDQKPVAEHFVKPAKIVGEKLKEIPHHLGKTGAPILEDTIGYLECEVREIANDRGDHAVVIGEVVDAVLQRDEPALTLMDTGWNYGG